jgi:DNA repair exonuclease SbcCD ATPase subunit
MFVHAIACVDSRVDARVDACAVRQLDIAQRDQKINELAQRIEDLEQATRDGDRARSQLEEQLQRARRNECAGVTARQAVEQRLADAQAAVEAARRRIVSLEDDKVSVSAKLQQCEQAKETVEERLQATEIEVRARVPCAVVCGTVPARTRD